MSRLQTGALAIVCRDVGLEEVVAAAVSSLGPRSDRVDVHVVETLPMVSADPALLERALANLIENALNFSFPEKPVRVDAGYVASTGNGEPARVDLRVIDRGRGIPRPERERVFRPFQRLGDNPNGLGVGLGLAVARGFIEAMDGEIVIEDTPGGGTTMVVSLPAIVDVDPVSEVPGALSLPAPDAVAQASSASAPESGAPRASAPSCEPASQQSAR